MNRRHLLLALAFVASFAFAQSALILSGATVTGAGTAVAGNRSPGYKTYQVTGSTSAGTGTAVVNVEGSNNGAVFDVIGSVSLSLTTTAVSNGFTSADRYSLVRGNVTTINGTGAAVSITAGY